jgi:iron(III) transport system permease protein
VLALPLAFPAYVLAYAYTDLLDHPGHRADGAARGDRLGPARLLVPGNPLARRRGAMLIFVLYPYVYLLARAAFLRQSPTPISPRARWGTGRGRAFWRVSAVARPAIAGGVILALMETIADFGTVAHFGVQTFATGIYSAWFSMGDRGGLAACALPAGRGAELRAA